MNILEIYKNKRISIHKGTEFRTFDTAAKYAKCSKKLRLLFGVLVACDILKEYHMSWRIDYDTSGTGLSTSNKIIMMRKVNKHQLISYLETLKIYYMLTEKSKIPIKPLPLIDRGLRDIFVTTASQNYLGFCESPPVINRGLWINEEDSLNTLGFILHYFENRKDVPTTMINEYLDSPDYLDSNDLDGLLNGV